MSDVALQTTKRTQTGKAVKVLRNQGLVPGIIYGQGKAAVAVQTDAKKLHKIYHQAGTSKLVNTKVDDEEAISTLFYDVQQDPLTQQILHFDLYKVKADEAIHTEVPLHFTGDSEAVIVHQAELMKNLESVEVSALPKDLPENIEVDISVLKAIGDSLNVGDLNIPAGVEVLVESETLVVKAEAQRETTEEELAEIEEDAEEAVEAEHGGAADEEGEEGAEEDGAKKDDKKDDKPIASGAEPKPEAGEPADKKAA